MNFLQSQHPTFETYAPVLRSSGHGLTYKACLAKVGYGEGLLVPASMTSDINAGWRAPSVCGFSFVSRLDAEEIGHRGKFVLPRSPSFDRGLVGFWSRQQDLPNDNRSRWVSWSI